ncbi:MAG: OsmC family protein [Mariprofundaceae bacterium]|nr:OsmC family protein [Mariprofundaceae bacterium]
MARLTANYEGGTAFCMECRGHQVRVDQPADHGGSDLAMTPPELFAASLSACIGHYVANYCNQAGISTDGLQVCCDWGTADRPRRIGEMAIQVVLPGMPASRRKAVERVASSCLLHATLQNPPKIDIGVA